MARHKLKPDYNLKENMDNMIKAVVEYYGDPYDDRLSCSYDHVSLRQVAKHFNITVLKARKILITANHYSIAQSREVARLVDEGMDVCEIMKETGLSKASVQSYMPYRKSIYNMEVKSVGADRMERWRRAKKNAEK